MSCRLVVKKKIPGYRSNCKVTEKQQILLPSAGYASRYLIFKDRYCVKITILMQHIHQIDSLFIRNLSGTTASKMSF